MQERERREREGDLVRDFRAATVAAAAARRVQGDLSKALRLIDNYDGETESFATWWLRAQDGGAAPPREQDASGDGAGAAAASEDAVPGPCSSSAEGDARAGAGGDAGRDVLCRSAAGERAASGAEQEADRPAAGGASAGGFVASRPGGCPEPGATGRDEQRGDEEEEEGAAGAPLLSEPGGTTALEERWLRTPADERLALAIAYLRERHLHCIYCGCQVRAYVAATSWRMPGTFSAFGSANSNRLRLAWHVRVS